MEEIIDGVRPDGLPKRRKTGGRQKGTPNKRTIERQAAIATIKASGKSPMAFFADLLANEEAPLDLRQRNWRRSFIPGLPALKEEKPKKVMKSVWPSCMPCCRTMIDHGEICDGQKAARDGQMMLFSC
jgi:hypothetical protein